MRAAIHAVDYEWRSAVSISFLRVLLLRVRVYRNNDTIHAVVVSISFLRVLLLREKHKVIIACEIVDVSISFLRVLLLRAHL